MLMKCQDINGNHLYCDDIILLLLTIFWRKRLVSLRSADFNAQCGELEFFCLARLNLLVTIALLENVTF